MAILVVRGDYLMRLNRLQTDASGVVIGFYGINQHIKKLLTLGLLPGTRFIILQKSPVVVLQFGYTQLAIDHEIAAGIEVDFIPRA